jgi:hypothetical protein
MDFEMIKNGKYEVTDDLVEKVEEECFEEGILVPEWDIFCVRFFNLFDEYEDCTDFFWADVQEELEDYQSIRSVLEMTEKDAYSFLDSVFSDGYREFEVMAREEEDVCFFGSANRYLKEEDEDFFSFTDENGYPSGRRFPLNRYKGKQELFSKIIVEFCDYTDEITDFIKKSDDMGEEEVFGDIIILIFSKY